MSATAAAATLAEMAGWSLSNLQIQKLLYLSQMMHLGETGEPIFIEDFEAWKLGPVQPEVYRRAKMFGSRPVESYFVRERLPAASPAIPTIRSVLDQLASTPAWKLVGITHWGGGAWAKNYNGGDRGCTISKGDILDEYRSRASAQAAAA